MRRWGSLLTLWVLLLLPGIVQARALVLCYPGGGVKTRDAQPSTEKMLRLVEQMGGWKTGTFESFFTSKADECDRWVAEKKPDFAIVSLGFWLDHGAAERWIPLVQPKVHGKTTEVFRVVVRKGTYRDLEGLKGRSLGGTVLEEPRFVERVIFQGRHRLLDFDARPTNQALKALRALHERELEAVIINDAQFRSLDSLPFAAELEVLFTSEPVPLMGVVADAQRTTPDERRRLQKAMQGFCQNPEGKGFCELFGIDAFLPANESLYDAVRALWK